MSNTIWHKCEIMNFSCPNLAGKYIATYKKYKYIRNQKDERCCHMMYVSNFYRSNLWKQWIYLGIFFIRYKVHMIKKNEPQKILKTL